MRKAASQSLRSRIRTNANLLNSHGRQRHVTFQRDLPRRDPSSVHPVDRQCERPCPGGIAEMTRIDHDIESYGGLTSTIECLPEQLRISKVQPISGPEQRIEELQRENGRLRQELSYYKDTRKVLMTLLQSTHELQQSLQETLMEASKGVAISEQRYVEYWAGHHNEGNLEENVF